MDSVILHARAALLVSGIELLGLALLCTGLYAVVVAVIRAAPLPSERQAWREAAKRKARRTLSVGFVVATATVLVLNGSLALRDLDPLAHTLGLLRGLQASNWQTLPMTGAQVAAVALVVLLGRRILARALTMLERRFDRWIPLDENRPRIAPLIGTLNRTIGHVGWLLLAVFAATVFAAPSSLTNLLLLLTRTYVVLAVGAIVIRSTTVIVDGVTVLSHRYAEKRGWLSQYEHLRRVLPTFRACLEYALWIATASVVLAQLETLQSLAWRGPQLIQAIGIFLAGRIIIELGHLEIERRMLPREGLAENDRRRRATMAPLIRSAFTYAAYFATAMLMLSSLGFNPMPFLAGAGILGLVVGFGAQSLINDVVSGFFILLENIYLVGDLIEVGGAKGVVEAIEFRTTRIRDAEGRVHVIRNGDMKPVINYSKDYIMAVVVMDVPYDADLPAVFSAIREAGGQLRTQSADVLADTEINGITAFGATSMTIQTFTRVRPGRQEAVATTMRLLLKEAFDRQAGTVPRKALVADTPSYSDRKAPVLEVNSHSATAGV